MRKKFSTLILSGMFIFISTTGQASTATNITGTLVCADGSKPQSILMCAYIRSYPNDTLTHLSNEFYYNAETGNWTIDYSRLTPVLRHDDTLRIEWRTLGEQIPKVIDVPILEKSTIPVGEVLVNWASEITYSPSSWNYGSVQVGASAYKTFVIGNQGSG